MRGEELSKRVWLFFRAFAHTISWAFRIKITMSETSRNWFLLTSKPQKDDLAELHLRNQDYEVYRPLAKRLRTRRGKAVTTIESLFPRYLFIHLDDGINDNWAPIRSTKGINGFVRFGSEAARIPDNLIQMLKAQEQLLGERAIDLDRFHNGDKVIITEGPFIGLDAVFQKYDGEERVLVLLEILHKQTRLAISPAQLQAA
jgi:transcriptional antiterminator RfaH